MSVIDDRQNAIVCQLNALGDWMEKYAWLIERAKRLEPIDPALKTDDHAVAGCQSRVWMTCRIKDGVLCFAMDSDAQITRGLIGLLLDVVNRLSPEEIVRADLYFIDETGLGSHLSPLRANGLAAIVKQMKQTAGAFLRSDGKTEPSFQG